MKRSSLWRSPSHASTIAPSFVASAEHGWLRIAVVARHQDARLRPGDPVVVGPANDVTGVIPAVQRDGAKVVEAFAVRPQHRSVAVDIGDAEEERHGLPRAGADAP